MLRSSCPSGMAPCCSSLGRSGSSSPRLRHSRRLTRCCSTSPSRRQTEPVSMRSDHLLAYRRAVAGITRVRCRSLRDADRQARRRACRLGSPPSDHDERLISTPRDDGAINEKRDGPISVAWHHRCSEDHGFVIAQLSRQCPARRVGATLRPAKTSGCITAYPADGGKATEPVDQSLS